MVTNSLINRLVGSSTKFAKSILISSCLASSLSAYGEVKEICYTEGFESFVGCVSPDGSNPRTVAGLGISQPIGLDIANQSGTLFINGIGSVSRIGLNGTGIETVFSDLDSRIIKLNLGRNIIYRVGESGDNISAYTLSGDKIAETNDRSIYGRVPGFGGILAFDNSRDVVLATKLVSQGFPNASYNLVELDWNLRNERVLINLGKDKNGYPIQPTALTIDEKRDLLYFSTYNRTDNKVQIHRSKLDGSEQQILLIAEHKPDIHDLAIDEDRGLLYVLVESGGFGQPQDRFEFSSGSLWALSLTDLSAKKLISPLLKPGRLALHNPTKQYDFCPDDSTKLDGGMCGCGIADVDSDSDGLVDCSDQCPSNPQKYTAGVCGCGTADLDSNQNGKIDCTETKAPSCKIKAKTSCETKFRKKGGKRFKIKFSKQIKQCITKSVKKCGR